MECIAPQSSPAPTNDMSALPIPDPTPGAPEIGRAPLRLYRPNPGGPANILRFPGAAPTAAAELVAQTATAAGAAGGGAVALPLGSTAALLGAEIAVGSALVGSVIRRELTRLDPIPRTAVVGDPAPVAIGDPAPVAIGDPVHGQARRPAWEGETKLLGQSAAAVPAPQPAAETERRRRRRPRGPCKCPSDLDAAGRVCGQRCSWNRRGGDRPECGGVPSRPTGEWAAEAARLDPGGLADEAGDLFPDPARAAGAKARNKLINLLPL
jgi:hypothetical protein